MEGLAIIGSFEGDSIHGFVTDGQIGTRGRGERRKNSAHASEMRDLKR